MWKITSTFQKIALFKSANEHSFTTGPFVSCIFDAVLVRPCRCNELLSLAQLRLGLWLVFSGSSRSGLQLAALASLVDPLTLLLLCQCEPSSGDMWSAKNLPLSPSLVASSSLLSKQVLFFCVGHHLL